ncbi:MAG: B12-binding domain-containing radical SAM protein, partial [Acutalibacteraceae bacterium]
MKKVYFVQVGFGFDESVYLPYAVGTIIAYCNADAQIKKQYEFSDIIFRRERLNDALAKIQNPYLVAFSCSVWNVEYNKALAKMIKEKYPDAVILFGGHSVSEDLKLIESEPYIDILMFGEGEESFCNLLKGFSDGDISRVNNIAYKNGGEIVKTPREFYDDISSYPSPYTSGVFNSLIKNNPGTDFLAVLETNRGCPYSC